MSSLFIKSIYTKSEKSALLSRTMIKGNRMIEGSFCVGVQWSMVIKIDAQHGWRKERGEEREREREMRMKYGKGWGRESPNFESGHGPKVEIARRPRGN